MYFRVGMYCICFKLSMCWCVMCLRRYEIILDYFCVHCTCGCIVYAYVCLYAWGKRILQRVDKGRTKHKKNLREEHNNVRCCFCCCVAVVIHNGVYGLVDCESWVRVNFREHTHTQLNVCTVSNMKWMPLLQRLRVHWHGDGGALGSMVVVCACQTHYIDTDAWAFHIALNDTVFCEHREFA